MSRLYDEDGIDGPFERGMRALEYDEDSACVQCVELLSRLRAETARNQLLRCALHKLSGAREQPPADIGW